MIKKGFTLSELLISLAIVGVVAAVTVPGIVGRIPNENKIKMLKAHSALTSTVADLASDPTLYYDDGLNCIGFSCTGNPLIQQQPSPADNINNASALEKFARLFASRMNLTGNFDGNDENGYTFTTSDGTAWTIEAGANNDIAKITFDVNEKQGTSINQSYASLNGGEPNGYIDRFQFFVDERGGVTAVTGFEEALLADPSDLSSANLKKISSPKLSNNKYGIRESSNDTIKNTTKKDDTNTYTGS